MIKILVISYRWIIQRCIFCGSKKRSYHPFGTLHCCPTDAADIQSNGVNGCSLSRKFI